jgi:DNA gyrase subunit A
MLVSSSGKTIRFKESDVRAMGRTARGVRGMRLGAGHRVISLIIPQSGCSVLTVSRNGYGKRTLAEEFPLKGRGGQGVIGMHCSDRNGMLVGAIQVHDDEEMMLISDQGTLVRTRVGEVSILSRNTQGVRVIRLKVGETLVGVESIAENGSEDFDDEGGAGGEVGGREDGEGEEGRDE